MLHNSEGRLVSGQRAQCQYSLKANAYQPQIETFEQVLTAKRSKIYLNLILLNLKVNLLLPEDHQEITTRTLFLRHNEEWINRAMRVG